MAFNMYKKQQTQGAQVHRQLPNELHGKVIGSKKYVDLTKKNSEFTNSLTINESVLLSNEEDIETSDLNSSLSRQKKKNETKSSRKDKIIAKKRDSKKNNNINYIGEIDENDNMISKIERSAK